jgi:hypothetical protein
MRNASERGGNRKILECFAAELTARMAEVNAAIV